jgi:hypothetical protein
MSTSASRDRISVDLRGLKAALIERARRQGVTPSDLIRALLAEALGEAGPCVDAGHCGSAGGSPSAPRIPRARISLRLYRHEAQQVRQRAIAAGMPLGAFVASLCADGALKSIGLLNGQRPVDQLAALAASSAELSTLARDLRHLTQLLRQGNAPAAQVYRHRLETADRDVRAHLVLAAALLAELQHLRARLSATRRPQAASGDSR